MKKKTERGRVKYLCSTYDNYGKCQRNMIDENFLIELIEKRFEKEATRELIEDYVDEIVVENKTLLEIKIKDQESILLTKKHLRF